MILRLLRRHSVTIHLLLANQTLPSLPVKPNPSTPCAPPQHHRSLCRVPLAAPASDTVSTPASSSARAPYSASSATAPSSTDRAALRQLACALPHAPHVPHLRHLPRLLDLSSGSVPSTSSMRCINLRPPSSAFHSVRLPRDLITKSDRVSGRVGGRNKNQHTS